MFSSFTKLNTKVFSPQYLVFNNEKYFQWKFTFSKEKVILLSDKNKVTLHIRLSVCSSVQHSTQPKDYDFWPLRLFVKLPKTYNLYHPLLLFLTILTNSWNRTILQIRTILIIFTFLAVHNSSIGLIVPCLLGLSVTTNDQSLHNTTEWP